MLYHIYSNLFDSPAQTLVNTINTVGVMGKGIAKVFKERHPAMYFEYRELCNKNALSIGDLHLWKGGSQWVLNFPTKTTWKLPSRIEYIEEGLENFSRNYEEMGIVSVAFPPLGCGNGNLSWKDVRPLMESYLAKVQIPVYIHSLHVGDRFVPEHKEVAAVPTTYDDFRRDIAAVIHANKGAFSTGDGGSFSVHVLTEELGIERGGRLRERIRDEEIERAWVYLRDGLLSVDKFPDSASRRYKSYLFPILRSLPYVGTAPVSRTGKEGMPRAQALFFVRNVDENYRDAIVAQAKQECLFP